MLSWLTRDEAIWRLDSRLYRAVQALKAFLTGVLAVDLVLDLAGQQHGLDFAYSMVSVVALTGVAICWYRGKGARVRTILILAYALLAPHLVSGDVLVRNTPLVTLLPAMIALVLNGPALVILAPVITVASATFYLGHFPLADHPVLTWFLSAFVFSLVLANRLVTDWAIRSMNRRSEALTRTQGLLSGVTDNIQAGVLVYTPDKRCIYWNRFMGDLTSFPYKPGMETDALQVMRTISSAESAQQLSDNIDRAVAGETFTVPDEMMRFSTSARVAWLARKFAPYLVGGEVVGVVETVEDVTDLRKLRDEVMARNREVVNAYDRTLEGWVAALDLRDNETRGHSDRVVLYTVRLARAAGFTEDEIVHVRRGALLHDIGKLAIPDAILKKQGSLTPDEWTVMRSHPMRALDFLRGIEFLRPALAIPLHHHERWNGSGYPYGLTGEQIPHAARLFAVVDVFDALRSDRPYREAWDVDRTLAYLREQSGAYFCPMAVDLFVETKPWEGVA